MGRNGAGVGAGGQGQSTVEHPGEKMAGIAFRFSRPSPCAFRTGALPADFQLGLQLQENDTTAAAFQILPSLLQPALGTATRSLACIHDYYSGYQSRGMQNGSPAGLPFCTWNVKPET